MAADLDTCPRCWQGNNVHAEPGGHDPGDGDLSICWRCRGLSFFVAGPFGLTLRPATDEETAELHTNPQVRQVLGALAESYDPVSALYLLRGQGGGH